MSKMTRPTNNYNLISTLLSTLDSGQCQLNPRRRGRVGHSTERVATHVYHKGQVRYIPERDCGKFGQYPEGITASVAYEGDTTKSGCLNFDPGGNSTMNWRKT